MKLWPEIKNSNLLIDILGDDREVSYWKNIFDRTYSGKINAWSYQWLFACWKENGMSIFPKVNLVENIGFGDLGTHTKASSAIANLKAEDMSFPLSHPKEILRNREADRKDDETMFSAKPIYKKIVERFCSVMRSS
jgi:hypothetical protein